jgi:poly-gamma-glutamate synthesis protein (capsule biosynthesis protein)
MLGRSVLTKADKLGDYSYSFGNISKIFKPADIVFVNLESPFYENCPRSNTGLKFCTDFKMADELVKGGVNVVTLANNHITNYGQEGLTQTQTLLDQKGIAWCGFGQLAQKEVEGVKFGFLGFNFTSQGLSPFDLTQIKEADNLVDILIVGVHWGEEYKTTPSENQKKWAEQIIKAGGDIIAGHHPHWVQEMEYINGKPIYFSLGNLIFDQLWSEKTKFGEVVELSFWKKKLTNQKTYKIYMGQLGLPEIVE